MSHMHWRPLAQSHRKRLDLHLHLLEEHRPDFFQSLGNLRDCTHRIEIIEEDSNLIGVREHTETGVDELLPQYDGSTLLQQQRSAITTPLEKGARLLILSGIGVGHVLVLTDRLLHTFSSAGCIAWEPDQIAWAAFLSLFDARPVIENSDQIYLFSGKTIHEQVDDFIDKRRLFLFPTEKTSYVLGTLPCSPPKSQWNVLQAQEIARYMNDRNESFAPVYSSFVHHAQSQSFSKPASIFSTVHRGSYIHLPIANAFLEGFKQHGLESFMAPFDSAFGRSFEILGTFFEKKPDLFLTINAWPTAVLHDLGMIEEQVESMTFPRLCWMVDDTLILADEGPVTRTGRNDYVFCCDRSYLPRMELFNCQAFFLPHATLFQKPGTPRPEFQCDLSYVGSLPDVNRYLKTLPSVCQELLERVEEIRNQKYRHTFSTILDELDPSPSQKQHITEAAHEFCQTTQKGFTQSLHELEYFLYNTATFFKRYRTIQSLLPLGLKVFGPVSWKDVLPAPYQDRYGGFISPGDLADCYASSKICLNIHSHQCPTCLNPRDFDVPMAGSVVLGDWVEDVDRGLMEPGREIMIYRTLEEATTIAEQLLHDRDALNQIKTQGQQRVMKEHTYGHRAKTVLERIRR